MSKAVLAAAALLILVPVAMAAQDPVPFATLESLSGSVQVGTEAAGWAQGQPGQALAEAQTLKTGPGSGAAVRFTAEGMLVQVGENSSIALQDLLLKARLEKMRGKISKPGEGQGQTRMEVTPLTGVRGTEEADGKAQEPKREHHWEEDVEKK